MMKLFSILIAFVFVVNPVLTMNPALAAEAPEKIQKDVLQLGRGSSLLPKEIVFDSGDGGSNKKLSLNPADNEFDLNSTLDIAGDLGVSGALDVTGASAHRSGVKLGDGTNASKSITMDRAGFDPYLKWDETSQKWVFSNDGSVEKKFGSGSGGDTGITVLLNGSLEDGFNVDWTSSGGTYTSATYGNPPDSDTVYGSFTATLAGQYVESVAHAIPTPVVGGCLAKINYHTTDTASWKLQVYDGSSNLLSEQALGAKSWQDGTAPFPCPSAGTNVKLRIISLASGLILFDRAYLGKENRTFQVAQARLAGEAYFAATANCSWSRSTTTLGALTADTDCPGPSISKSSMGTWLTTDADLPQVTINSLPAGRYKASFIGGMNTNSTGSNTTIAINESSTATTCEAVVGQGATANSVSPFNASCYFDLSTVANRTFSLLASSSTGSVIFPNNGGSMRFILEYIPLDSQTAVVPEAQDWMIDVNIGGGNPTLSTSSISSYNNIDNATLDLVTNSGSAPAKIACGNGVTPTGATCTSGNENLGVVMTNPVPGWYEACISFSHSMVTNTNGYGNTVFQLVETTPSSTAIVQDGRSRSETRIGSTTTAAQVAIIPVRNCSLFYFSSVAERAIRLYYEQAVAGTITSSVLPADRSSTEGQRDINITVKPILTAYPRPYLVGNDKFTEVGGTTYSIRNDDTVISATSASASTLNLPSAALVPGKIYHIFAKGGGLATVVRNGTDTIEGLTSFVVTGSSYESDSVVIQSTGAGWIFLNGSGIRRSTCQVAQAGGVVTSSGYCDSWVTSYAAENSNQRVQATFKTGIFSSVVTCLASLDENSQNYASTEQNAIVVYGGDTTSFSVARHNTSTGAATASISPQANVLCFGKR